VGDQDPKAIWMAGRHHSRAWKCRWEEYCIGAYLHNSVLSKVWSENNSFGKLLKYNVEVPISYLVILMIAKIDFWTVHLRAALPKGVQPIAFHWAKSSHSFWETEFRSIFQVSPTSEPKGMSTALKPWEDHIALTDVAKQPMQQICFPTNRHAK
jgi:hypothetical protein